MIFLCTSSVMTTPPPAPWPTHHHPQFKGCEPINRTQAVVFMWDILLQLTAHASHYVFLNLFPSSETKFFGFSWQLSKWGSCFEFVHLVVLCLMSLQYPCELLQTLNMEAVHPASVRTRKENASQCRTPKDNCHSSNKFACMRSLSSTHSKAHHYMEVSSQPLTLPPPPRTNP
jgi:hypothetical protein